MIDLLNSPAILHSAAIHGDGFVDKPQSLKPVELELGGYVWFHLCNKNKDTKKIIAEIVSVDDHIITGLLENNSRPRLVNRDGNTVIYLRSVKGTLDCKISDMVSVHMLVNKNVIITLQDQTEGIIDYIADLINNNHAPKNTGDFIATFTNQIIEKLEPHFETLQSAVDAIEEDFESHEVSSKDIDLGTIRTQIAIARRHIIPQEKVYNRLVLNQFEWLHGACHDQMVENNNRMLYYIESLNDLRDRTIIINDEIKKENDERLNKNTHLFSIMATIFLPLSFLTGLLGVNVAGMPGMDYIPSFWLFVLLCFVLVFFQILWFQKKKWL
ncbi:MAG: hypothetical protein HRU28_09725 [Rhizobiales bacterium]|nr:hypothetical protein [Hyphomicrobiales bacterium]